MKLRRYFAMILMACLGTGLSYAHSAATGKASVLPIDSLKKATQNPLAPKKSCCKGSPSKAKMLAQQKKKKQ